MFHDRPALRALNETAWKAMLWGIETSPLPEDDDDDLVCVNAHDRCYGGAGGPSPS
jgi:hypothetical protein